MFQSLLDILFGCRHKHRSFPITARAGKRRSGAAQMTGTYVVCLDCGQEFPYDWQAMKIVAMPVAPAATAPLTEAAEEPLARSA